MKSWLIGALALVGVCLGASAPALAQTWPGQCPGGTDTRAIGCMLQAVPPADTDLIPGWQIGQTQHTRAFQWRQLRNGGQDIGLQTVKPAGTIIARSLAQRFGDNIYARDYGVVADGVTSDDVALHAAIEACAAKGTRLILPAGRILLTGAGATSFIRNCAIEGVGFIAGQYGDAASVGTLFLLTSMDIKPFQIGSNWKMSGVGFYWPNQTTGMTAYPFLMSPATPTTSTVEWTLDNVVIVNAYNGVQAAGGAFFIVNSLLYATNELFEIANIGDSFKVSNVHFTPGPWFQMTNFAATSAMDAVTHQNMIFRFMGGGAVPAININLTGSSGYAWRYGVVVESGVRVGLSTFDWYLDGTATVVEIRDGGGWGPGNRMSGGAVCRHVHYLQETDIGNAPCFNFTAGALDSYFDLSDWGSSSAGSLFENAAGANIVLNNADASFGEAKDGGDYYAVHTTVNRGGLVIDVKNSTFNGIPASAHVHGIKTVVGASRMVVQNTAFLYLNDSLDVQAAPTTILTGNWSIGITGARDINAATMASSDYGVVHMNNSWEKPPVSTIGGCNADSEVVGAFSGYLKVCSTIPTSTFTFTMPWPQIGGGGGACIFMDSGGIILGAEPSSSVRWTVNSFAAADIHGHNVWYNCPGQN